MPEIFLIRCVQKSQKIDQVFVILSGTVITLWECFKALASRNFTTTCCSPRMRETRSKGDNSGMKVSQMVSQNNKSCGPQSQVDFCDNITMHWSINIKVNYYKQDSGDVNRLDVYVCAWCYLHSLIWPVSCSCASSVFICFLFFMFSCGVFHMFSCVDTGLELLKLATRQYAKRQVKWIRNRFLKRKKYSTF